MRISFFVPGQPQTKGSAKAVARGVLVNDNEKEAPWAHAVAWLARRAFNEARVSRFLEDVELTLFFHLPRPKSHRTKRGVLKPTAPNRPKVKPDIDKMTRSILDALTGIAYEDDGTVTRIVVEKRYARGPGEVGVLVAVALTPPVPVEADALADEVLP